MGHLETKELNDKAFNNVMRKPDQVASTAVVLAKEARDVLIKRGGPNMGKQDWVRWIPPEEGWVKLNMDGARKASTVWPSP